jgi:predicted aspartyl protease
MSLGLSLALTGGAAWSREEPAPVPETAPGSVSEAEFAIPTTRDRIGRIIVPVLIEGKGPFRFMLDTGANRSALSEQTAQALGLVPIEQSAVTVHGITGAAAMPVVRVRELRVGELQVLDQRLPVLPAPVFGNLDGILGIDCLQESRIDVDFEYDRITVRPSPVSRGAAGRVRLDATLHHGGLLLLEGRVGRVRAKAILDTGAERSLGNEALRDALLSRSGRGRRDTVTTVVGATAQLAQGKTFIAPNVDLGGLRLSNLAVTFGDLHVFRVWSLLDEPTLLIGMDLLGHLQEFSIDYPRREFYMKVRKSIRAHQSTYGPRHSGGPGYKE